MNYIKESLQTESKDFETIGKRVFNDRALRLLHGAIGASTEAGELLDALKKHIYYGKGLDVVNFKEEIGDIFWYLAILCDELGVSFEEIQATNIAKLSGKNGRYKEGFTSEEAINRDVESERKVLEA